jgi:hypothetical protein
MHHGSVGWHCNEFLELLENVMAVKKSGAQSDLEMVFLNQLMELVFHYLEPIKSLE